MSAPAPAWYVDPYDAARVRWWNGDAWTTAVREHPTPTTTVTVTAPAAPAATPPAPSVPPPPPPPPTPPPPPAQHEAAPAPPASALGAPSIGAARLPPLSVPTPPPAPDGARPTAPLLAPDAPKRSNRLRLVLVAGLAVALLALAFAVYSTGMLGSSTPEASTPGATVYEGSDFSLEAPEGWDEAEIADGAPDTVAMVLRGPGGEELGVVRSEDPVEIPEDPEVRRRLIDLLIATETAVFTQGEVLGRASATLDGQDAELFTVQGVAPNGENRQAFQVATLYRGRMYAVVLSGPTDVVADSKSDFDAIVASFRFA